MANYCPECGAVFKKSAGRRPRSPDQLRRFFALMKAAHYYWPETHDVQFPDYHDLRKWLIAKSGRLDLIREIQFEDATPESAFRIADAAIRAVSRHAIAVVSGSSIRFYEPRSISFEQMPHGEFCRLNNDVDEIIRAETGLDAERILTEYKLANVAKQSLMENAREQSSGS